MMCVCSLSHDLMRAPVFVKRLSGSCLTPIHSRTPHFFLSVCAKEKKNCKACWLRWTLLSVLADGRIKVIQKHLGLILKEYSIVFLLNLHLNGYVLFGSISTNNVFPCTGFQFKPQILLLAISSQSQSEHN